MKVDILESEAFASLLPDEISGYLTGNGWREVRHEEHIVSIWEYANDKLEKSRVWLPLDVTLSDYALGVARLIRSVAVGENRSQLEVLEDLETTGTGDVVRAGTWDEVNKASSSIPFDSGSLLLRRCYKMTHAAAWSAVEKRAVYPQRTTTRVQEYLRRLRLGQTERGSYRVKLISPFAPPDTPDARGQVPLAGVDVPFERKVVMSLVNGLDVLQRIALETQRRGRFVFDPFDEAVPEGISANLCEALAVNDVDNTPIRQSIEINVSWGYSLGRPSGITPKTITFGTDLLPPIAAAAAKFRETHPEDVLVSGFVRLLGREPGSESGEIRIFSRSGRTSRVVRVVLGRADYHKATQAHDQDQMVACEGRLIQQGYVRSLQNPQNFRIISTEPPDPDEQITLF